MKYAMCFGAVYSLTNAKWKRYLQAMAIGEEPGLDDFGAKLIAVIECDVTDFDAEEAIWKLQNDD